MRIESSFRYVGRAVSPHYRYHGIPFYLEIYASTCIAPERDAEVRHKMARNIVADLKSKDPFEVKEEIVAATEKRGAPQEIGKKTR